MTDTPDAPTPFTPPDCDLRGYEYMPLFGHRLFSSDLYAEATDAEFRAALRLWWGAWQQCPAGSLPRSEAALAMLADYGRDLKGWAKVRDRALHGFVLCSDGRLYHPMLCREAVKAYDLRLAADKKRGADRERLKAWREAKLKAERSHDGNGGETGDETPIETRFVARGREGKGREEGTETSSLPRQAAAAPVEADPPDARTLLWREGSAILQALTGKSPPACKSLLGKWLQAVRDDCPRLLLVLQQARETQPMDPLAWITAAVQDRSRAEPPRQPGKSYAGTL